MKKIVGLLLAATMMMGALLGGCSQGTSVDAATPTSEESAAPATEESTAPADDGASSEEAAAPAGDGANAVKTGLAVVTSFSKSKDATAGADGQTQADVTYVAVTVDDGGVIDQCVIDTVQGIVTFDATGTITADLEKEFDSKHVLADGYGMKPASAIGKEWYEQADALQAYFQGKTVEEIANIETDDSGHVTDADLVSSATISIDGYRDALAKAVGNAEHLGAQKGETLKLNSVTNIAKSKDATAEGDGLGQAYATMMAVTLNGEDVITSCIIDSIQANVNFDATGAITSDLSAPAKTKKELGEDYGMRAASGIGKEWFEQAEAFEQDVTGKTVADAAGMTVEDGHAVDLVSSVTISVDDYIKLLTMAN